MFNVQNQQVSRSGKNVSSLHDVEQAIKYLNSLENWIGNEDWLASIATELNKQYRELRQDIRENTDLWSYSQYCERLAYHYYNLACYYNDELFNKHKIGLENVKTSLEKCLERFTEISQDNYSNGIKELKDDAEKFLAEVNEICKQQRTKCSILKQCFDKNRQKVQNIQLLKVINTLEDAITVPEYKNTFIAANQADYLSQAYQLAGQFSLSARYARTAKNLSKKIFNPEERKYNNEEQHIKAIIMREIKEYKSNLDQIEDYIEEEFQKSLSSIDIAYIERKYVKYCSKLWLQEIMDFLKKLTESKNSDILQKVFNSLDDIKSLNDVPNFLKQLDYYNLLIKHYKLINKENEKILISRFKKECLEQTVAYCISTKKELIFLEAFLDFLSLSKSLQSISFELELEDFCCGTLSFDEFLKGIIELDVSTYGTNLAVLQEAAKCLQEEEDLFLIDKFKEVISAYIKPVEIQERKIDGRLVIEVIGKNVVVSEILCQLENKLSKGSNIEEVRFVGADTIHIDTSFKSEVWRGRNVVILTKAIKVHNQVTLNVSGKDNNHFYSNNAGTEEDGHGKRGKDGYPGESGGNVLILVEKIENPKNFTIISNGGNGSTGQDGGNGRDGKDRKGITNVEFKEKFPAVADFESQYINSKIVKIVRNIKNDSATEETVWYTRTENATIQTIIDDIADIIDDNEETFENYLRVSDDSVPPYASFDNNIFIETVTSQGGRITFSFERGGGFTIRQAFFLYKGSLGQPGGYGGKYGLGGQGGYAGEIMVRNIKDFRQGSNIIKSTKEGKEGEKGKGGLYGSHGTNGWDMGYVDYKYWNKAKFFGYDKKSKCTLKYYDSNSSDRVWCPYKKKYAEIVAANIENKKQKKYEERKSTRQNSDRQQHAQAVRKKNILQDSILANYSHHLSSIYCNILQHLQSDLENTKRRALQAITEHQEQQKKQTMELGIKCHVSSIYSDKNKRCNDAIPSDGYKNTTNNTNGLIDKLKGGPQLLHNWLQLRGIELARSELNDLFFIFKAVKKNFLEKQNSQNDTKKIEELQSIEKLLINKYRLATLQEIAKQLLPYREVTDNIELTPEEAIRYLVEGEKRNNISHPILGTLNQYLYENSKEQREKVSRFYEKELQSGDEILKCSLKMFILEVEELKEVHTCIKNYCDEYKEFLKNQEHNLSISFEAFKSELSQPRYAEMFSLWMESIKDKSLKSKFEEEVQKDDNLKALYNHFNNQFKEEYDWSRCCKDQDFLKQYDTYILEKGPLSRSYRELLARIFDINIRLYIEDQDNKLSIQNNHNHRSKHVIYILQRDNEFIQLDVDENYLKLEEERKKKNDLYANTLIQIESFKQKYEFDNYLSNNRDFPPNNSLSKDEQLDQTFNEKGDIEEIIKYCPEKERQHLKLRLEKVTFLYTGQQGILRNILKRFSSDGKHVSYQELCCLVNSILSFSIENRKEQNIFCWIVAAHSQGNWINELILLQLENRFKRQLEEKPKWREYLSKIRNINVLLLFYIKLGQGGSIPIQCIEDSLHLLSNIPNDTVNLEGLELSEWPYVLKEKYWLCKLLPLTNWQESEKLPTASYYLLSIENIFGTDLVEKLLEAIKEKKQELSPDVLTNILSNFYNEKWNLSKVELNILNSSNIDKWKHEMQQKFTSNKEERKVTQLIKLIKGNANTSKEILNNLSKIKSYMESIDKSVIARKAVNNFTEDDIKNWAKEFQGNNVNKGKQYIKMKMLAVIDRAVELKRKFKLRNTQRLTILALLMNDHSTLAQVSTGEGKSLIVVAASIMKTLCGEKVDIVTSSSVLAKRDVEGNRDIYNLFDINVSHNCSEDIERRKEAYSGNQVVYGDLPNFQRDYLLDKFYGKNILGNRNFENMIVDEVDSMLLDKGNNMLYLSHDLANLDKLESVYIYIWQWINRPASTYEEISYALDANTIKEAVLSDLYGLIKKEDIGKLSSELSEQQKKIMWERLVKAEIIDNQGKLLKENIEDNQLNEIVSPEFSSYKDCLNYLLKLCVEREKFIHVPNHLKSFVEQHLESWINSAITAFFMKAGQDYVVDIDRTGTNPDRNPNITILDKDTGTDQVNSQWDEALHQFLQLKHGCKLSLQSLKAVFISNVSFFKLYSNLFGLTGTLGSQRERDLLQKIYQVDFVTIPTAKSKQFHEDKPILCTSEEEWISCLRNEVNKFIEEKKRSVLIICETVNDVEILHKAFGGKNAKHIHAYVRDYEEYDITQGTKELEQGQIIIATNLAGRGTDIKITEGLKKARGLHVCLTYLPSNIRIEQQAFGRTARSGDEGSGQLIIMNTTGREYSNSKILDLKKERDAEELRRISDIKSYYEIQITKEENWFKKFKAQFEQLKKDLDDKIVPTEVKEILLQSCLDKWAFWLDQNNKYIRDFTDEQGKRSVDRLLDEFISQLKHLNTGYSINWQHDSTSWLTWVQGNPVQMVKLGRYLSQNKYHKNAYDNAIELFNDVIEKEPYFSEAARYYKAFTLAQKIDWEQRPLKEEDKKIFKKFKLELREAAKLLDEHCKIAINVASIISKIKKNNNESIIQIDAYEAQKKTVADLYYKFSQSIDNINGHFITPQSFVNGDITEELAEVLYEDLLRKGVLKKPRVKKNISVKELKPISSDYGVSVKILQNFLSRHEGRQFNEKEFQKVLKGAIPLPSREVFWKSLIDQKILNQEVKYVIVDDEKLKNIDLSLLDNLKNQNELEKQTLELKNEQIILYSECVTQQKRYGNIFKKNDFVKTVGKDKYTVLKEKGVLSFNKKASINLNRMNSTIFSCYDSITLEDFVKVNITENEAEQILAELVEQKVVENSENSTYRLKIKFDEIEHVHLLFRPVYENVVRGLLSVCFTYRIVLQKIVRQLEEKNFPIRLQLMTKPHQSLALELLERKIVKPTMVGTNDEDLEEKLKSTYSQKMKFKIIFSQDKFVPGEYTEELINCLIAKKWIAKGNPIQDLGKLQNINKKVEKKLDNQLQLAKEDTIKNIANILKRSRSLLKALKVPDINLKSLTEFYGQGEFANAAEVHVFSLNGLDQLLQLGEKKWTQEMLLNTATVTAAGISQIVIGTVIELYSVGIMTHIGGAFVSEGLNDLFFAASTLKSGYFSWKDYEQHKLKSLMISAATVGIGAYLTRGAKISRFGYKLAGPGIEVGGRKVAEMSGIQLIKITSLKVIGKEVAKRIAFKAIEGVAFALTNAGADMLIENYLQALCEGIASNILSDIEQKVEGHSISINLCQVYKKLGEESARKMISDLTEKVFNEQNFLEKFLPIANKIVSSVTQGIANAVEKRSKTGNKLTFPIHTVCKITVWSERVTHVANIITITDNFLNNLENKIREKLDSKKNKDVEVGLLNQKQEGYEEFKRENIEQWKSLLLEKSRLIISEHIVSPIFKKGVNCLVKYIGKEVQKAYQSFRENRNFERFEELKQKCMEELQREQHLSNTSTMENHITEKYHKDLLELLKKTRDASLFAAIVREHIPMDITCVNACTQVLHCLLKEQGISVPGLTTIVKGVGGIRQQCSSVPEGTETITITLELKNNHFELCGSGTSGNNTSGTNCLYEALSEAIPELRDVIAPEEFRAEVANCIERNKEMQYHIGQGWHELPISLGAVGGARRPSRRVPGPDLVAVSAHFQDRCLHFFRFGAIIQRISEQTNVDRDKVVTTGPSEYQDCSSNQGIYVHAAHIVRFGKINTKIKEQFKSLHVELKNVLGQTQNVERWANLWPGVGGDIDRFQSRNLRKLAHIDFSKPLSPTGERIIGNLKNDFIAELDKHINREKLNDYKKFELLKAKINLTNISEKSLFEIAKTGYTGEGMDVYR